MEEVVGGAVGRRHRFGRERQTGKARGDNLSVKEKGRRFELHEKEEEERRIMRSPYRAKGDLWSFLFAYYLTGHVKYIFYMHYLLKTGF
jgi:hypothetical protein